MTTLISINGSEVLKLDGSSMSKVGCEALSRLLKDVMDGRLVTTISTRIGVNTDIRINEKYVATQMGAGCLSPFDIRVGDVAELHCSDGSLWGANILIRKK